MKDIRAIIKETVGSFKSDDKCPTCNGVGHDLHVCPKCQAEGTVGVPQGVEAGSFAQCKSCGTSFDNLKEHPVCQECNGAGKKINKPIDNTMETHNVEQSQVHQDKGDMFERFSPNQLNALLETLMRNPKQFDQMYTALANDGFMPLNEGATYATKRKIFSEMIKDGQLAKQMLQTLVESNQIQVEATDFYAQDRKAKADMLRKPVYRPNSKVHKLAQTPAEDNYTGEMTMDDVEQMNQDYDKFGRGNGFRAKRGGLQIPTLPVAGAEGGEEEEGGALPVDQVANPEEENPEAAAPTSSANPEAMAQSADDEILSQVKGGAQAKTDKMGVEAQMQKNKKELADLAVMAGFTKPDGSGDFNSYSSYLVKNYDTLDPNQKEVADWFKGLLSQQKQLSQNMRSLQTKVAPPVDTPEFSSELEPAMGEAKNYQLRKGVGASELQLRAGTKGKVFEGRLRKLEPYKKVAVLEFLENDPRMLDDQDYADMATLTGINEDDLVAMRIEYENSINEITYPVIGGQDVHGQNKKNETKELNRELRTQANRRKLPKKRCATSKSKNSKAKTLRTT